MEITWYGLSCFRITERGYASIVTDPYGPDLGLPPLKLKADVVTISHDAPGHNYTNAVKSVDQMISGPGEYEVGGVFVTGLDMRRKSGQENNKKNTLYVLNFGGLSVAHLGDLNYVPSQAKIENLGGVDIALVPVGGGGALAPSQAAEVISLIEPSIVIPMHYATGSETLELGQVDRFLKEMGIASAETQTEFKAVKSGLSDETQVILLERKK
jgi:L-ascorbate metabolism protein UlaG (beta-lactamase superfamily)